MNWAMEQRANLLEIANLSDEDSDSFSEAPSACLREFFRKFSDIKKKMKVLNEQLLKIDMIITSMDNSAHFNNSNNVGEMLNRLSRKLNIILFHLPERFDENLPSDVFYVRSILNVMGLHTIYPRFISRIGILRHLSRPRPIKISFENSYDASMMLKLQPIMKAHPNFNALALTMDRSKSERRHMYNLRVELRRRRSYGDIHSRIRYIGGVPMIIRPTEAGESIYYH